MKSGRFKQYIKEQINLINKAKWKEGEETGKDPGNSFIFKWAAKYAKRFRKRWIENDIKKALHELDEIIERTNGNGCDIVADIKEKLEEAMELLEE